MEPLAARHGIDHDLVALADAENQPPPDTRPEAVAFLLVRTGCSLLVHCCYADGFPGDKRRACRRGARLVCRSMGSEGSQRAAVFLTQAMARLMKETMRWGAGDDANAALHDQLRDLVEGTYPMQAGDWRALARCAAEYALMASLDRRYRTGVPGPLERALRDGDDPTNPELLERQYTFAGKILQGESTLHAIALTIGADPLEVFGEHLVIPRVQPLERTAGDQVLWNSVAEEWQRRGKTAHALGLIGSTPPFPPD
jgi:hypothetical protein